MQMMGTQLGSPTVRDSRSASVRLHRATNGATVDASTARASQRMVRPADAAATSMPTGPVEGHGPLIALRRAFRPSGGIIAGDALAALMRDRTDQPLSLLARWIVNRDVVSFEAHGQTWLPLFQFDFSAMEVSPAARQVIGELRPVFDDWELTEWFASPNTWLGGASPADALASDARAVVDAARADRFVAAGC